MIFLEEFLFLDWLMILLFFLFDYFANVTQAPLLNKRKKNIKDKFEYLFNKKNYQMVNFIY